MSLNDKGFFEPKINKDSCINCSKCLRTCPLDKKLGTPKMKSWYGWNNDREVCFNSSSGGIFRAIANSVIKDGGIVYGAVYSDDLRSVVFSDSDHSDLNLIQKSKYTVSNPSGVYSQIKTQLLNGRRVLFCGTPCQNAGLTSYLGKDFDNLIRCDFVCGGMASLAFYREHLDMLGKKYASKIRSVDFRPKSRGWGKQWLSVEFENGHRYFVGHYKDSYFKCFIRHESVRKVCLDCEYYSFHVSDLTLADFWGYKAAGVSRNKKGLSLIMANSEKGIKVVEEAENLRLYELDSKFSDYAVRSKSPNLSQIKRADYFLNNAKTNGFEKTAASLYKFSELVHIMEYIKTKIRI